MTEVTMVQRVFNSQGQEVRRKFSELCFSNGSVLWKHDTGLRLKSGDVAPACRVCVEGVTVVEGVSEYIAPMQKL